MQERVDRLRELVATVDDADEERIEFLCSVEYLIPKYVELYGQWVAEDPTVRGSVLIVQWAMDKLLEMDAERFVSQYELKRHVYALGKKSANSSCKISHVKWLTSKNGSPTLEEETQQRKSNSPLRRDEAAASPVQPSMPSQSPAPMSSSPATNSQNSPSRDTIHVVESMQARFRDTLLEMQHRQEISTARQIAELQTGFTTSLAKVEPNPQEDKFQAISSLDIKRHLPTIADGDPDTLSTMRRLICTLLVRIAAGRKCER